MTAAPITPIAVQIDDRARLLSALLALTTWPEQEQAYKPHGVHVHARTTRTMLAEGEYHPAVITMQELLETDLGLDTIFSAATAFKWPDLTLRADAPGWLPRDWPTQMREFIATHPVFDLWQKDRGVWEDAAAAAQRALATGDPLAMLARFFGPLDVDLFFLPNLCYPTSETLGFRSGRSLICIAPPPIAWGTNPPWPYDDNPADTARAAFAAYAKLLLGEMLDAHPDEADAARKVKLPVPNTFRARYPGWFDQFAVLFVSGATALYLRETFGEAESKAYIMMVHKANGIEALPNVVNVMDKYLSAQAGGKYASFAGYMPTFIKSLRIAENLKRI